MPESRDSQRTTCAADAPVAPAASRARGESDASWWIRRPRIPRHQPATVPGRNRARRARRAGLPDRLHARRRRRGRRQPGCHRVAAAGLPGQPGHLADPPGNEPIADGLAPEQNATLQVYNYADYVEPAVISAFEAKYKCKVNITTFNDTERGADQGPPGNRSVRRVDGHRVRPDLPAGHRLADPAAEPQLHPEHHECLAVVHQPLVRPEVAVHGARSPCTPAVWAGART